VRDLRGYLNPQSVSPQPSPSARSARLALVCYPGSVGSPNSAPSAHKFNLWTLLRRAPESGNRWEAHVLELGVVTYGDSLSHVIAMANEASYMVLVDDIEAGRNPLARRAPDEDWQELYELRKHARFCEIEDIDEDAVHLVALNTEIDIVVEKSTRVQEPPGESRRIMFAA
jgi:hypothetical protein